MIALEEQLKKAQAKCVRTPSSLSKIFPANHKYYDLYCHAKEWLSNNILKHGNVKVACDGGGFYTDHGIDHCESIVRLADKILDRAEKKLNDYEVFVFLMSVLMHDAGMVHGRPGHGHSCRHVSKSMKNCLPKSEFEQNMIFKIAESHQGKTINGSSDTLGVLLKETHIHGIQIRPALLASLLRLFDEISEDRSRSAIYLLDEGELPVESRIHHAYASCITSVNYDSSAIKIDYYLPVRMLKERFELYINGQINTFYMFDWICSRLAKINSERQYCCKFLWGFLQIERVLANVVVIDDNLEECKEISIQCIDNIDPGNINSSSVVIENKYTGEILVNEVLNA